MKYDLQKHHRRSIRLKGYDYSQPGAYFVTIVTQDRACLFGDVVNGKMWWNEYGRNAREEWFRAAALRPYVQLFDDEFVIMPNHVHGIIWIVDDGVDDVGNVEAMRRVVDDVDITGVAGDVGTQRRCVPTLTTPSTTRPSDDPAPPTIGDIHVVPGSLGAIVRAFKSAVARRINALRSTPGESVWQRNYYEHIIRNDGSLNRIRQYITQNPLHWELDRENPAARHLGPEEAWLT